MEVEQKIAKKHVVNIVYGSLDNTLQNKFLDILKRHKRCFYLISNINNKKLNKYIAN
mgnify:CR=1 FL=1